ncbi:MAG: hypothetical protein VX088_00100 [Pseudomonadota bacterium]|jgi:hypothetical protein|nr:hypothetical protein [Gammaproteobacteria bacterium]MEC7479435.1 hypothetical protein [Pseudomonadota bacterium]MEC7859506.1 hypothetical protein [Pseudomonadota bacterium]MEC8097033.1 hypothetical protein [Pseudomonadota bacterium]|tara:strand:- start:12969 stop:13376 length:408 start_codon:yes stop_codon:yes gene_type:complete
MSIETLRDFLSNTNFWLLLQDPSLFFEKYLDIEISNIEFSVIIGLFCLFVIELKIKNDNKKYSGKEIIRDEPAPKLDEKNEISSDPITQKIDLAIAYLNMGSTRKAKSLLGKLKQLKISKKQLQQIDGVLADIKK